MPGLTVTEDGAFAAIWDVEQRARIRIDFVGDGKAKWVIATEIPTSGLLSPAVLKPRMVMAVPPPTPLSVMANPGTFA